MCKDEKLETSTLFNLLERFAFHFASFPTSVMKNWKDEEGNLSIFASMCEVHN